MLPFISTFSPVSAVTGSSSTRLTAPVSSTLSSASLPGTLPALGASISQPKSEKSFADGPGYAPVPGKLFSNSNWTEWSTIQGVIARVISKLDEREARGRFEITSTITP